MNDKLDDILNDVLENEIKNTENKNIGLLNKIENRTIQNEKIETAVTQYLINKDEEETKLTLDFARALLAIEVEIKDLRDDQKEIKNEAKDNGVSVTKVTKALNDLKRYAKAKESDLAELEEIEAALGADVDIKTQINQLTSKK